MAPRDERVDTDAARSGVRFGVPNRPRQLPGSMDCRAARAAGPRGRPHASLVLEGRLALLDEGRHALLLVGDGELRVEHPALEADALGQRRLVGAVDALF